MFYWRIRSQDLEEVATLRTPPSFPVPGPFGTRRGSNHVPLSRVEILIPEKERNGRPEIDAARPMSKLNSGIAKHNAYWVLDD